MGRIYIVITNAFGSAHGKSAYESVAAPVSNNEAGLVELNNVAAPN